MSNDAHIGRKHNKKRTIIGAWIKDFVLVCVPGHHFNEIGHKWRYQTLQQARIITDHMLFVHIGLIVLGDNCFYLQQFR